MPPLPEGTILTVGSHQVTVQAFLLAGGFSQIYRVAMDPPENGTSTGCLKQVIVNDKAGLATLRKEVDVMKTLRDAGCVVRYFDSNAERLADGTYQVLVLMELCPNKSLLEYMNARIRTKLGEAEILAIMRDIAVAVYEMHRRHLVHRDIKIENVLIGPAGTGPEPPVGQFKLADFGLVARPTPVPSDPLLLLQLGHDLLYQTTPQYRAPEMVDLYRGVAIDERADIWALGCFLYKLCYYTTPFEAQGDVAILHAAYAFPPTPPYSGDLKNLVVIMLQENAAYRPNIVQLLMLLARMRGEDFALWNVEDFYGAGEYNFHALHEMQRRAQQALHAAQVHPSSGRVEHLEPHADGRADTWIKSESRMMGTTPAPDLAPRKPADQVSAPGSQVSAPGGQVSAPGGQVSVPGGQISAPVGQVPAPGGQVSAAPVVPDSALLLSSPQTVSATSNPASPLARTVSPRSVSTGHTSAPANADSDGSDVDLDLGELALEDAEVRYPSLDELDLPVTLATASERAKSYESVQSFKDKLELEPKPKRAEAPAPAAENAEPLEIPEKAEPSGNPDKLKDAKPSMYENVEAWQQLASSSLDKDAERLAEAIFISRSASGKSRSLDRLATANSPVTPVYLDEARRLRRRDRMEMTHLGVEQSELEKLTTGEKVYTRASSREPPTAEYPREPPRELATDSPRESPRELPRDAHREIPRELPREARDAGQPQAGILPHEQLPSFQTHIETLSAEIPSTGVPRESVPVYGGSLAPINKRDSSNPWSNLLAPGVELKSRVSAPALDLIDLDGAQADARRSRHPAPLASAVPHYEEVSLLDVDLDAAREVAPKPVFKKKRDILSQPLAFQEEVIDFASDDENTNSEMSRVAIRDSLRRPKGRKSFERRSDSTHAKRRLFFGE